MKRFLSVLLASLLVLSLAAAMVVSTSAALEGDWVSSRSGADYEDESSYCPAAGYHYDPELGFVLDPPVYANDTTPFVQAHTRNPLDLKANNDGNGNSVSVKVRVLEYAYDGGENKDQWIAFTLNSQPMSTPGSVEYGEGLCILIRGGGYGSAQVQPFYVDKETGKSFSPAAAFPQVEVPMNDQDQEEYTFTVKYVDGGYVYAVNGHEFVGDAALNAHFDRVFAEGAYVSVVCQTGVANTKISLAITEWQGDLPVGDDSADPEEDLREKAPIADSATIEANMPAVLWDSTCRDFRKISVSGGVYTVNEDDGAVKIKTETVSPYISFGVKSEVSYEAADFPYIAVLTRNCWANSGNVYYCAGPILTAENSYSENWDPTEFDYGNGWTMGIMDFSDYNEDGWYGRINSLRIGYDFSAEDIADEEYNTFDVAFIGAFRSVEEAEAFTQAWLTSKGYTAEQVTTEETTTEEKTEAPTTNAPETNAPTTDAGTEDETEAPATKSCGAVVAAPVVALVALMGVAFVAKKKD